MQAKLAQLKVGVHAAGLRPAPLAPILHLLRRFLWPLIRQYHYYGLENLASIATDVDDLRTSLRQFREEAEKAVTQHAIWKTELTAAVHRQLRTEHQLQAVFERFSGVESTLSMLQSHLHEVFTRLTCWEQDVEQSRKAVDTATASVQAMHDLVQLQGQDVDTLRSSLNHAEDVLRGALEGAAGLRRHLGRLDSQIAQMHGAIGDSTKLLAQTGDGLDRVAARVCLLEQDRSHAEQSQWLSARVEELDFRTRLFLTVSSKGLFLAKRGDLVSDSIASEGCWDEHIVALIESLSGAGSGLAVDAGAHIGFLSVVMSRRFSQVESFEPNAFVHRLLAANVVLNGCSNVSCHQTALYSKAGQLSLAADRAQEVSIPLRANGDFDGFSASNLGAYAFAEDGTGLCKVEARTLDSYSFTNVRFVKIDAQGADGQVLFGAKNTISAARPVVVFEWEDILSANFGISLHDVMAFFSALEYKVEVLHRTNQKQVDYVAWPGPR